MVTVAGRGDNPSHRWYGSIAAIANDFPHAFEEYMCKSRQNGPMFYFYVFGAANQLIS